MIQPLHDALPGDRRRVNREFLAIVSSPDLPPADARLGNPDHPQQDIRRIASMLFCSSTVDPSIVSFAKLRTAQYWGLTEDEVDLRITARLLVKAGRLMRDRQVLAADESSAEGVDLAPAA